jgi:glycine/D-amino acid oxidase-like deaminating enzyme
VKRHAEIAGAGIAGLSAAIMLARTGWTVGPILLQKSKVAGPRIFRENTKRKATTDSDNLNRIAEVACEFNVRR